MNLQTEIYISIDNENFYKIDLAKNESINMKYVLKDTTDLSKIFSPFSLSFTFPGILNNQRIFGFVGNTKVFKTKTDNVFACKIYSNGLLSQTGKLKLTEVREENGFIKSFTANFTTTMISLQTRMGSDLINDLPTSPIEIKWLPNDVFSSLSSIKVHSSGAKYYVPLISRNRIFQRRLNTETNYLDNVFYVAGSDPTSTKTLKSSELRPAIQGRTIIDLIKAKYNLVIDMPLESTQEYNDWYVYCNAESTATNNLVKVDLINPFSLVLISQKNDPGGDGLPSSPRYIATMDTVNDTVTITQNNSFYPTRWGGDFELSLIMYGVIILDDASTSDFLITIKRSDGRILLSETFTSVSGQLTANINITDEMFIGTSLTFSIEISPKQISAWNNMDVFTTQEYYHTYKYFTVKSVERK